MWTLGRRRPILKYMLETGSMLFCFTPVKIVIYKIRTRRWRSPFLVFLLSIQLMWYQKIPVRRLAHMSKTFYIRIHSRIRKNSRKRRFADRKQFYPKVIIYIYANSCWRKMKKKKFACRTMAENKPRQIVNTVLFTYLNERHTSHSNRGTNYHRVELNHQ